VTYLYLFFTGAAVPGRAIANTAIGR